VVNTKNYGNENQKSEEEKFFTSQKYSQFICDFEDKWLQYASAKDRTKAFFGNIENAQKLFAEWKRGVDVFSNQRKIAFSK
jgi:hypothetical protein